MLTSSASNLPPSPNLKDPGSQATRKFHYVAGKGNSLLKLLGLPHPVYYNGLESDSAAVGQGGHVGHTGLGEKYRAKYGYFLSINGRKEVWSLH